MLLTVYDLSPDQLNELKETYIHETRRAPSWADIINARKIPDSVIIERYAGYSFTNEDFYCTAGR